MSPFRAIALATLGFAAAGGLALASPASADDFNAPVIADFTFAPSVIQLPDSGENVDVTASFHASDAGGVVTAGAQLVIWGQPQYAVGTDSYNNAQLVSGTPEDGTWSVTLSVPPGPTGTRWFEVAATDSAGNVTYGQLSTEGQVEVVQCPCDSPTPPTVPGEPVATPTPTPTPTPAPAPHEAPSPTAAPVSTTATATHRIRFPSCAKLTRVFPHGVARSRAAATKQVRHGNASPATSKKAKRVYAANASRLDRDHDGTACEG